MRRKGSISVAVGLALAVAGTLAGCSVNVHRTVTVSSFDKTVQKALAASVGQAPNVDCGDDPVDLEEGEKVHCTISVDGSNQTVGSVATISDVSGDEYHVDVKVNKSVD